MKLIGSVKSVIYRNNENGYSVVSLDSKQGEVVAVGKFPIVSQGEELSLEGEMISNSKYGLQFSVKKSKSINQLRPNK